MNGMTAATETSQITVRLPVELLQRLDRLAQKRTGGDRSVALRDAVSDYLAAEVPSSGSFPRAVKAVWQTAVLQAFQDEGVWWTPLSSASFWDMDPNIAANTRAVCVRVHRVAFTLVSGPRVFAGDIEWSGNVNTPEELYKAVRGAIREKLAQQP